MNNNIDTIKIIRQIREENYDKIKNKSNEEIISFFKEKSKQFINQVKAETLTH